MYIATAMVPNFCATFDTFSGTPFLTQHSLGIYIVKRSFVCRWDATFWYTDSSVQDKKSSNLGSEVMGIKQRSMIK